MAEAVIFVGLQGAGKTTYYHERLLDTHVLISGDVQGSATQQAAIVNDCVRRGVSFVIDNTNVTRASRSPYIHQAKQAGYDVLCCFFDTPVRTAIGRNNHRGDKKAIPVPAILRNAKKLEPPGMDEGFDEIRIIRPTSNA